MLGKVKEKEKPTKFRIEVEKCNAVFIFEAQNHTVLQRWMAALYENWAAGEAVSNSNFV